MRFFCNVDMLISYRVEIPIFIPWPQIKCTDFCSRFTRRPFGGPARRVSGGPARRPFGGPDLKFLVNGLGLTPNSLGQYYFVFCRIPCCVGGLEEVFRAITNRLNSGLNSFVRR